MSATIVDLFEEIKIVRQKLDDLAIRLITGTQISAPSGLSEISISLGLVSAGEFRAGNNLAPGEGFSGTRIGYPGFYYPSTSGASSDYFNIVGVDADSLAFGIRSSDGAAIFGLGFSAQGIELTRDGLYIGNTGSTLDATASILFRNTSGNASSSDGAIIFYNADHLLDFCNNELSDTASPSQGIRFRVLDSDGVFNPSMRFSIDQGSTKTRLAITDASPGAEIVVGSGASVWAQADSDGAGYVDFKDGGSTLAAPNDSYGRLYIRNGNLRFISTDGVDYQLNTT